jgi:hypothetical protein
MISEATVGGLIFGRSHTELQVTYRKVPSPACETKRGTNTSRALIQKSVEQHAKERQKEASLPGIHRKHDQKSLVSQSRLESVVIEKGVLNLLSSYKLVFECNEKVICVNVPCASSPD